MKSHIFVPSESIAKSLFSASHFTTACRTSGWRDSSPWIWSAIDLNWQFPSPTLWDYIIWLLSTHYISHCKSKSFQSLGNPSTFCHLFGNSTNSVCTHCHNITLI
jgi:hypothetical protein